MTKPDRVIVWSRAAEDAYADDLLSAYRDGAAAAFGLMGMAEAIRARMGYRSTLWHPMVQARPITFDGDVDVDTDYEPFI